jgi:hypothetical protein
MAEAEEAGTVRFVRMNLVFVFKRLYSFLRLQMLVLAGRI